MSVVASRGWRSSAPGVCFAAITGLAGMQFGGCGGGGGGGGGVPLPPPQTAQIEGTLVDSPQSLSDAIHFEGGVRFAGSVPTPGGETGGTVSISTPELVVSQNSSFLFELHPTIPADRRLDAFVVKVAGASEYFIIPVDAAANVVLPAQTAVTGTVAPGIRCASANPPCAALRMTPSGTISEGSGFTGQASAQAYTSPLTSPVPDLSGIHQRMTTQPSPQDWTPPINFQIRATPVVASDPQVSLTWDRPGDIDLHVTEPDGTEVFYSNRLSLTSGGSLDTDNQTGYGPENVSWATPPPAGNYLVDVVYFAASGGGAAPVNFTVVVINNGQRQEYRGSLSSPGDRVRVTTFSRGAPSSGGGAAALVGNPISVYLGTGGGTTGITVFTTTRQGHFSGQFPVTVRLDGASVPNQSAIQTRAAVAPTTCEPNRIEFDRVSFAVSPGLHTIEGTLAGNSTFGWPEVRWTRTVFVPSGACVTVNLAD